MFCYLITPFTITLHLLSSYYIIYQPITSFVIVLHLFCPIKSFVISLHLLSPHYIFCHLITYSIISLHLLLSGNILYHPITSFSAYYILYHLITSCVSLLHLLSSYIDHYSDADLFMSLRLIAITYHSIDVCTVLNCLINDFVSFLSSRTSLPILIHLLSTLLTKHVVKVLFKMFSLSLNISFFIALFRFPLFYFNIYPLRH